MLTLRNYQKKILESLQHLASLGLFMGTGTGKTITSLVRASSNPTKYLLIICPFSVLQQWESVINQYFPHFKVLQFKKSWTAAKMNNYIEDAEGFNTIIVNYEIIHKLTNLLNMVDAKWTIILDESHNIKSVGSSRHPVLVTNAVIELGKHAFYKMILTATPAQGKYGGYVDYYSQLRFLGYIDEEFDDWARDHVIYDKMNVSTSPYPIKVIKGYKNTDDVDEILNLCCVYYEAKFGDFEPEHIKVTFDKPSNYARTFRTRVYKDIVMKNISRKRIGLKTLCTGNIMGLDFYGERYYYEDNSNKLDWLKDFLLATNETVAIYYQYKIELQALKALMEKIGKTYIVIDGSTKNKYSEINDKTYDVMLGQFQAASEALDGLQYKCHIMVLFAMPESSTVYKQMIGRINRDGQTLVPLYYYLVTEDTIEDEIYKMVNEKIDFNETVLNKILFSEGDVYESEEIE